jgi:hypothetical protein
MGRPERGAMGDETELQMHDDTFWSCLAMDRS